MKTAVAAVARTFTWCQEFGVVWVVQGILEGGDRYALGVLESHVGNIPVWLVLKHPRLCQDLVDLLHCAPAAPASHVPQDHSVPWTFKLSALQQKTCVISSKTDHAARSREAAAMSRAAIGWESSVVGL